MTEVVPTTADLVARRAAVIDEMGGKERIARLHEAGRFTVREHIARLVDGDSFSEIGTFAQSDRQADRGTTPGDGKVGGRATIDGRPVTVMGDDITVKRGSSSTTGSAKVKRLWEQSVRDGLPMVYFSETGGARIPDMLGSEGFVRIPPPTYQMSRRRAVPLVSVVVGESYGGSSFVSALSDFVVQIDGSCLAVTSARVIEIATGEVVTDEELGGAAVHARTTGQIDRVATDPDDAVSLVRRFLSYLPSNQWSAPPRIGAVEPSQSDIEPLVPANRRRGYDMRGVVRGIVDEASFFELQPDFARNLIVGLARLDGRSIGVIANQPLHQAGSISPDACDKAVKLLCLCDAFDLPVVFLHDTPGFVVGTQVEHQRLLQRAMLFQQATALMTAPRFSVIVRKSYGLASHVMAGPGTGADLLVAWPGSEISFMDPNVAANVVYGARLDGLVGDERVAAHGRLTAELTADIDPYGAAHLMKLDEIIEPNSTRRVLCDAMQLAAGRPLRSSAERPLAAWPACW